MWKQDGKIGMKPKGLLVCSLVASAIILSGCWNKTELSDLAFVTALAIDKAQKQNEIMVSLQVVLPGNVTTGITGGGTQGVPVTVLSSKAKNIIDASRKATKMISRRLYYAHCNIVVISEEIAKDGIHNIIDALERDPEFRTTATVVVTRNSSAKQIVDTVTPLDKIPAKKVRKAMDWAERVSGENVVKNVDDVIVSLVSKGKQPVIGGFVFEGDKKAAVKLSNIESTLSPGILKASGIAIFNGDKLAGWMHGEKAKTVLRLENRLKQTPEYIQWKGEKEAIGIKVLRSNATLSPQIKRGKPKVTIEISEEGNIIETSVPVDLTDPKMIKKIENSFEGHIKKQLLSTINEAKDMRCDIFGFGEKFHKAYPEYWKTVDDEWNDIFAALEVEVKINLYIRRTGNRSKSFLSSIS